MQYFLLFALGLATLAQSTPVPQGTKSCQQYNLPITITSLNLKWAIDPINTNEEMAEYNFEVGRRDSATAFHPYTLPTAPETATYTISGSFCQPSDGGNGTLLLATHGGGYDR